jgi:hypothetical protein
MGLGHRALAVLDHPFLARIGNLNTLVAVLAAMALMAVGLVVAVVSLLTEVGWVPLLFVGAGLALVAFLGIRGLARGCQKRRLLKAQHPVLRDIEHREGCPRRPERMESFPQKRPDGIVVTVGACLDCSARAYRHGDVGGGTPDLLDGPEAVAGEILADLFREGHEAMQGCRTVPAGSAVDKLNWRMFGGTPQEQIERESRAREWDARVASELWDRSGLKQYAPEWGAAGAPPPVAPLPDQSHTHPQGLGEFYETKLARLGAIIERVNS